MSPARPDPEPVPTAQPRARRRSRSHRWPRAATSEAPLSHLRLRCIGGAGVAFSTYLGVIATTVVQPSALTLKQIIGLEIGLGAMATLCAVVAIVLWVLTQNSAYAMLLWSMADNARNAGLAANGDVPVAIPPTGSPAAGVAAIPIERGHQVRQQRAHRAG